MSKTTCAVPGCKKKEQARQMCAMHYARWKRGLSGPALTAPARKKLGLPRTMREAIK